MSDRLNDQLRHAVKARLADLGMKQNEMAAHVGITEKHVSCFLTGQFGMTVEMLDRVANATGCRWEVRLVDVLDDADDNQSYPAGGS